MKRLFILLAIFSSTAMANTVTATLEKSEEMQQFRWYRCVYKTYAGDMFTIRHEGSCPYRIQVDLAAGTWVR